MLALWKNSYLMLEDFAFQMEIIIIQTTLRLSLVAQRMQCRRPRFDPWNGKIPWEKKWKLTPVCLPGEFNGQRSLVGYSPGGGKQSDMTQRLTLSLSHTVQTNSTGRSSKGELGPRSRSQIHPGTRILLNQFFPFSLRLY